MPSVGSEEQQYRFAALWYPRYFFTRRQPSKPVPKPVDGPQWKLRLYENLYESKSVKSNLEHSPLHKDIEDLFRKGMSWKEVDAIVKPLLGETYLSSCKKVSTEKVLSSRERNGTVRSEISSVRACKSNSSKQKSLRRKMKIAEKASLPQSEVSSVSERLINIAEEDNVETKSADEELSIECVETRSTRSSTRESVRSEWGGVFYSLYNKLEKFSLIRV